MRMRGTSSDRILAKKLKREQKSLSSLGDKATNSSGSTSSSLFEKHLGKFYRLGKLEKSKRSSASALYDRSPTEAFYNKTGSARLSSQELFEKFCSEDFVSLYGHENDNGNYYNTYHSKSVGSSGSDVCRGSNQDSNIHHDMNDPSNLQDQHYGYTENIRFYSPRKMSVSHANLGAIRKIPQIGKKIFNNRTVQYLDYSTDSDVYCATPNRRHRHVYKNKFSFEAPFTLSPGIHNISDYEINDSNDSLTIKDHSLSAPLLSPDKVEARFTFDISEKSEGVSNSNQDETLSDATETRNLTLYEEPHSDRTSISDIYELSFSAINSKRSSFRRDGSRRKARTFDLSNLDFRAIDDESPNTSNYISLTSPDDTVPFNSDTKSCYSDSVFTTPEKKSFREDGTSKCETIKPKTRTEELRISERSDSTTLEDEPKSIFDKLPEILVEKVDQLSLDNNNMDTLIECSDRSITSPYHSRAKIETNVEIIEPIEHESTSSSTALEVSANLVPTIICSRPSMHKLEPFIPKPKVTPLETDLDTITYDTDKFDNIEEDYQTVISPPELTNQRERSMVSKLKKVRDSNALTVHKRTRCFPL